MPFSFEPFAQATIDALRAHICVLDGAGVILAVNKAWRDFASANGLQPDRAGPGVDYLAICNAAEGADAESASVFAAGIAAITDGGRDEFSLEYPCHSSAERRWFIGRVTRLAGTGPTRLVVAHEDITDRKLGEETLRESEQKFRTLADFTYDWETWFGPDGRFVYASPSCERITGYRPEEFLANPRLLIHIAHPEDRDRVRAHFRKSTSSGIQQIVFRLITAFGEERWLEHFCQPVRGPAGEFLGRRASNRDITERKRAEAELAASREQLRALARYRESVRENERSQIAREIHDQLSQDLVRLKMDIASMMPNSANRSMGAETAQFQEKLAFMTKVADSLLNSVQRIATELRPVVLDSLGLCAAIEWLTGEFETSTGIRCRLRIPETDPLITHECSTALFRILQESLTNATRHAAATAVDICLKSGVAQVMMRVRDNGCGFRPGRLEKPGSFGLLGMRERAKALGGDCRILSHPGKGTTVDVHIPLHQEERTEAAEK